MVLSLTLYSTLMSSILLAWLCGICSAKQIKTLSSTTNRAKTSAKRTQTELGSVCSFHNLQLTQQKRSMDS